MKKVAVFIDVQNLQEVFEKQGAEIRYDKLKEYLEKEYERMGGEILKFVAFVPYKLDDERRLKLIDAISLAGYRVITKIAKERPDGSVKANMDLEIAIEVIIMYKNLDEIVLVSGDSDFAPLIDYVAKKGIRVRIIGPGRGPTAIEIIREADDFDNLDEISGVVRK